MAEFVSVMAFFQGRPGDTKDELCSEIFMRRNANFIGAGSDLQTGERDQQWEVLDKDVIEIRKELLANGFKLEPKPDNFAWC